jgi:hypothetical protein
LNPVITGIALPDPSRIPLFLGKTGNRLRTLAKAAERAKIAENPGKLRLFSDSVVLPHNLEVTGSNPVPAT